MKHNGIHLYMQAIKSLLLPEFQLTQGHLKTKKKKRVCKQIIKMHRQ